MSNSQNSLDNALHMTDFMDHMSPEEKQELRDNCTYALTQFGEGWLDREDTKNHPLRGFVGSSVALSELGELGQALRALRTEENFSPVMERLKNKDQFEGAYSEVLVGYWLKKAEVNFSFLHDKKNTAPDIKINTFERDICVEITTKNYPLEYLTAHRIYSRFVQALLLNQKGLTVHAVSHRPLLSSRHADQIISACERMLHDAEQSGFEEFHIKNVIDAHALRPEFDDRVPVKHRTFSFQMPKTDEYSRVRGTIKDKVRQLNHDTPGILLIFDQHFWPSEKIGKFASDLRHELEETIFEQPNLSGLVLITQYGFATSNEKSSVRKGENWIAMKTYDRKSNVFRYKVILFNKFAKYPLTDEEIGILKRM